MEKTPKNLQRIGMLMFYTGSETHASLGCWTSVISDSSPGPWMTESEPT